MGFGDSFNTALGIKSQLIRSQAGLADANAVNALADAAFTARKPDLAADRNAVDWGLGQMHAGVGMAQVGAERYGIDQRYKLGMSEQDIMRKNLALQSSAIDRDAKIFQTILDKQLATAAPAPTVANPVVATPTAVAGKPKVAGMPSVTKPRSFLGMGWGGGAVPAGTQDSWFR